MILGIDIGTTNIEYSFGLPFSKSTVIHNPLAKYGLDVMTRISRANSGKLAEMSEVLRAAVKECITSGECDEIRIAANTTMVHILMNYDCTNLGSFPFEPVHTEKIITSTKEFDLKCDIPVIVTPGLTAFVGGDIVSGLSILEDSKDFLFIDLGTNAEMVANIEGVTYVTSAAAGPAFETCSKGYATSAIDGLNFMLNKSIMDETGLLADEYFDDGYDCLGMHFSQKKIRDFQMAKSAIRTGIDILTEGICAESAVKKIYIAGTFGSNLKVENAISLGMFPEWFRGKTTALGNTSLQGTANLKAEDQKLPVADKIKEIVLANHAGFNENYINNMNF